MDFNLLLVVDVSQDVVAGNRMAAVLELILSDSFLADVDGLLAVELLRHNEQLLLFAALFLGFGTSQERHQLAPALVTCFSAQLVQVFLTQQNGLFTHRLEKLLAAGRLVETDQMVDDLHRIFYLVLLKEFL